MEVKYVDVACLEKKEAFCSNSCKTLGCKKSFNMELAFDDDKGEKPASAVSVVDGSTLVDAGDVAMGDNRRFKFDACRLPPYLGRLKIVDVLL